jgi:Uma2 family endonuclease
LNNSAIIQPLLSSPLLPVYLDELNALYAAEKKKRADFYDWLTEEVKAEFIEGEVICHSPAKNRHIDCSILLTTLLTVFVNKHELGSVKAEKALVKLSRNDFEPDICFFKKEKSDLFHKTTMFFPAPDFVVEILSDSTERRDRGVKMADYALHGVGEYWIVDTEKEIIEQYFLADNQYDLYLKLNSGEISSKVIDGFTIPVKAVFDKTENLATLQKIIAA